MPVLIIALLISAVLYEQAQDGLGQKEQTALQSHAQNLGTSLLVVRNALSAYMQANPAAAGPVDLAALGLPAWFVAPAGVHALIQSPHAYVYHLPTAPRPDLTQILGTFPSGMVGVARNGVLVSSAQSIHIALPAGIPNESIVLML